MTTPEHFPRHVDTEVPIASAELDAIAEEHIVAPGIAPAVTVAVAQRKGGDWSTLVGAAGDLGRGRPTTPNTVFDLASITKSFLATTCAHLVRQGRFTWRTTLAELLPSADGTHAGSQSVAALLSHRSGLVAHLELFDNLRQHRAIRELAVIRQSSTARGTQEVGAPVYSDLGYWLTGFAVERITGQSLDTVVADSVLAPLGLTPGARASAAPCVGSSRMFQVAWGPGDFMKSVAPTEILPFRGGEIRGRVHDDNAWAMRGYALAGHAGLFGTASGVARWGRALLDSLEGAGPWASADVQPLVDERPHGSLRMGFDGAEGADSTAGPFASPTTFGHLGFTGTSFWCNPRRGVVVVVLTNRVHPTRCPPSDPNRTMQACRRRIHAALGRYLGVGQPLP